MATGAVVNKCRDAAIKTIEKGTANTIANARDIAYSQVKQSGIQMGGKHAKQLVNNTTRSVIAGAKTSESSAINATKAISAGKNWAVQMGVGSITSKVSDCYSSAKRMVKSFYRKFF